VTTAPEDVGIGMAHPGYLDQTTPIVPSPQHPWQINGYQQPLNDQQGWQPQPQSIPYQLWNGQQNWQQQQSQMQSTTYYPLPLQQQQFPTTAPTVYNNSKSGLLPP
jgi:hypothetical protein